MGSFSLTVPDDFTSSLRLDKYIAQTGMNRSKLKSGLKELYVNGKKQKISCKVKAGDKIDFVWEETFPTDISPENIPLDIIYEDNNVCVINKAQGMVVHPAAGNWQGTLVNALLYHWGRDSLNTASECVRPGIVHRLDKETSGLIITAKNRESEEWLGREFRSHRNIKKEYIAICMGRPSQKQGKIVTNIIRDPKNRKRFKAVSENEGGKRAVSFYKVVAFYGNYTLIKVRILTGRTHQIRVHMKYLNCPVLGDSIYSKKDSLFPNASLMLHARYLKIRLPQSKEMTAFHTPTPERFLQVEKTLKGRFKKEL